ncbi:MAG: anthranilate phosphoribosyltransferase [Nitrosomonas sp.]|nr:anthranilate phosphoribosyltransferase [Nitrosomonas sp.]
MTPQTILAQILEHREIAYDDMVRLMHAIMAGEVSPVMTAALITGLRVKRETIGEIAAAAQVMRELAVSVHVADTSHLIDTCGTGGDGCSTFNISTATAFVAAAAGARVAKHGGRSVSSKAGSADVLEFMGISLAQTPQLIERSINEIGIGFMFAPNFHHAMKHAAPVRRELGVRTLFNLLGPLTNPARASNQLLGVFHADLTTVLVHVLQRLGSHHAMVVHGCDGLDEITLSGPTQVAELRAGEIFEYTLQPEDFGLPCAAIETLQVTDPADAAARLKSVMENQPGPARDIVLLNAGAAIYVAGLAGSIAEGIELAHHALVSGAANEKLQAMIRFPSHHS